MPLRGVEPLSQAPEARVLSIELQGLIDKRCFLRYNVLYLKNFVFERRYQMDWCQMAIFLYCGALLHFFADFLSHRWKEEKFIYLHCTLYSLFFIPLFLWLKVDLWWLIIIFLSHLIIDRPARKYILLLAKVFAKEQHDTIAFGFDQIFHLLTIFIVALFIF